MLLKLLRVVVILELIVEVGPNGLSIDEPVVFGDGHVLESVLAPVLKGDCSRLLPRVVGDVFQV